MTSDKQRADISDTLQQGVHDCEGPDAKGISDDDDADVELEEPAAKWKYQPFTIQDVRAETGKANGALNFFVTAGYDDTTSTTMANPGKRLDAHKQVVVVI